MRAPGQCVPMAAGRRPRRPLQGSLGVVLAVAVEPRDGVEAMLESAYFETGLHGRADAQVKVTGRRLLPPPRRLLAVASPEPSSTTTMSMAGSNARMTRMTPPIAPS
jgi:hypothetical protein